MCTCIKLSTKHFNHNSAVKLASNSHPDSLHPLSQPPLVAQVLLQLASCSPLHVVMGKKYKKMHRPVKTSVSVAEHAGKGHFSLLLTWQNFTES